MGQFSFEALFMLSLDLMVVASTDGFFKRANPAFCKALGYSEAELLARPFLVFVHPDDARSTGNETKTLASGVNTTYFENRYRRKDGSWRLLAWTASAPLPGDDLIYCVARDITEQRAKEKERELMVEKVRSSLDQATSHNDLTRMCSFCKNVETDIGGWEDLEPYLARQTKLRFSSLLSKLRRHSLSRTYSFRRAAGAAFG